jgi:hypothetical protein
MDTAGLLIADPCYVIKQGDRNDLEIQDYSKWVACKDEILRLKFKRGHEGAGVIVHSPNGDGSVDVCGEVDSDGAIRSVYFSFDGTEPISRAEHNTLINVTAAAELLMVKLRASYIPVPENWRGEIELLATALTASRKEMVVQS